MTVATCGSRRPHRVNGRRNERLTSRSRTIASCDGSNEARYWGRPTRCSGSKTMKERYGNISLFRDRHVVVLEIDRPPHNFVNVELLSDLADALAAVDADPVARTTVLATAGKSFCAGADFASPVDGVEGSGMEVAGILYSQAARLFSVRKPIVAAIQGAAIGAGLGLALVADFRVAAHEARFSANFVKLGFHPGFAITYTLPRLIGEQRAALMCLTGRRIKGDEALLWGPSGPVGTAGAPARSRCGIGVRNLRERTVGDRGHSRHAPRGLPGSSYSPDRSRTSRTDSFARDSRFHGGRQLGLRASSGPLHRCLVCP